MYNAACSERTILFCPKNKITLLVQLSLNNEGKTSGNGSGDWSGAASNQKSTVGPTVFPCTSLIKQWRPTIPIWKPRSGLNGLRLLTLVPYDSMVHVF
ncbi:hypothetical protein BDW72DRAFT_163955 [Aspergillus terricola var. indicus]